MGLFSWLTADSGRSIPCAGSCRDTILVFMHGFLNGEPVTFVEPAYDGHGKFGGQDYYEFLSLMNLRGPPDEYSLTQHRLRGIEIECRWQRKGIRIS